VHERRLIELITALRAAEQGDGPEADERAGVVRAQLDAWLASYEDAWHWAMARDSNKKRAHEWACSVASYGLMRPRTLFDLELEPER
jgi:hypothetical protein